LRGCFRMKVVQKTPHTLRTPDFVKKLQKKIEDDLSKSSIKIFKICPKRVREKEIAIA
ncbi:Hypothetical protein FKW44_006586, partial [Caligus rogercresseyi]